MRIVGIGKMEFFGVFLKLFKEFSVLFCLYLKFFINIILNIIVLKIFVIFKFYVGNEFLD